jgi:hypothetical protein
MQAQREGRGMAVIKHNFYMRSGGGGLMLCPSCFTPPGKRPGTYCTGDWVGLAASLANLTPTKIQTPDHPVHSEFFHIFHSRRNLAML